MPFASMLLWGRFGVNITSGPTLQTEDWVWESWVMECKKGLWNGNDGSTDLAAGFPLHDLRCKVAVVAHRRGIFILYIFPST